VLPDHHRPITAGPTLTHLRDTHALISWIDQGIEGRRGSLLPKPASFPFPCSPQTALPPLPQQVIGQHQLHHSTGEGRRIEDDTWLEGGQHFPGFSDRMESIWVD
jgi:hypothetical protein